MSNIGYTTCVLYGHEDWEAFAVTVGFENGEWVAPASIIIDDLLFVLDVETDDLVPDTANSIELPYVFSD